MKTWLVTLLLATVAMAGCFGDDGPADSGDGMDGGDGTDGGDGNNTGNNTGNPPGVAPVGEFAPNASEGTAPAEITFTYNASDLDGDALTWTLDADGDGTADAEGNENNLPGNFTFTYTAAGEYIAQFVVSDGNANHTLNELITISAPAGPEPEPQEPPQFEDRGEYLYEFETGHCHAKDFTAYGPAYVAMGTWAFAETNFVEGLQYEDNHPLSGQGAGFELPVDEDCVDGDLTAV